MAIVRHNKWLLVASLFGLWLCVPLVLSINPFFISFISVPPDPTGFGQHKTERPVIDDNSINWSNYIKSPYSKSALRAALPALCKATDDLIPNWDIAGVYLIEPTNASSLIAVNIQGGIGGAPWMQGRVFVATLEGEIANILDDVTVNNGIHLGADSEAVHRREVFKLADINGDGGADLPVQHYQRSKIAADIFESTVTVYSFNASPPRVIFKIFLRDEVDLSENKSPQPAGVKRLSLASNANEIGTLQVISQGYVKVSQERGLQLGKLRQGLPGEPDHGKSIVLEEMDTRQPSRI